MHHFAEPGFRSCAHHLNDAQYAEILDNVVVTCVDVLIVCEQRLLLGKRTQEPAKDTYWVTGGRMKPGESPRETAVRILHRETGTAVAPERLIDLNQAVSYVWRTREQLPQHHGCHMVGLYFLLTISSAEGQQLQLKPDFEDLTWVPLADVIESEIYHPAIRKLAETVMQYV